MKKSIIHRKTQDVIGPAHEIEALVGLMRKGGLVELEVENKQGRIRLVRGEVGAPRTPARAVAVPPSQPAAAPRPSATDTAVELAPGQVLVSSPMVGTFYRAASPDAEPFVREGDTVRKGQTLCIVEAMKMMNEIDAEVAGRIVRVLVENGQPIQYGHPLIVIEAA